MMLLAATGIEFMEEEALEELRGGGCVWVAPEKSRLQGVLSDLDFGLHWQDTLLMARDNLGEDVAYVQAEDADRWTVTEDHAMAGFDSPEEALSAAHTRDLQYWMLCTALREG